MQDLDTPTMPEPEQTPDLEGAEKPSAPKRVSKLSVAEDVAFSLAFIAVALAVNAIPGYLPEGVAHVFAVVAGTIGILGLSFALDRIAGERFKLGFSDMGIGILFFVLWAILFHFFNFWPLNLVTSLLLLGTAYGVLACVLKIFGFLISTNISGRAKAGRAFIMISQLVASMYVVIEILIALKIYK